MIRRGIWILLIAVTAMFVEKEAKAHCQIPCGIYGDHARVDQMLEDTLTIHKSIKLIKMLASKSDPQSKNQLVRWINTKEQHAERIIRTISDYFMAQKIKPIKGKSNQAYLKQLMLHHHVMVVAMKCKQNADLKHVKKLEKAIGRIAPYWSKK